MEESRNSKNITINRSILWIVIAGVFALGVFLGRGIWLFGGGGERGYSSYLQGMDDFRYIRPSIPDGGPDGKKLSELKPFRYKVDALITELTDEEDVESVAVYFRDLENGTWFGIGEHERFSPEHQLKLPVLIAYLKWAERNPLVLRKRLHVTAAPDYTAPQFLKPPRLLERGAAYTVNDLLLRMIAYGDDNAYALLIANLPPARLARIDRDLYVNYDPATQENVLTLRAYASFFRVLFNASYLNEEMSEKALRFLARSPFRDGMAAGLPSGVELASKAGERAIPSGTNDGELLQLHELGIVYYPGRPFLLGVTVRGHDFRKLAAVVRDITRLVYTEVDRQSK